MEIKADPIQTSTVSPEKRNWRPALRRTLLIFVVASLALHAMFGAGGIVSEKIAKIHARHLADQHRQEAIARKKAAEEKKAAEAKAATEETRKKIEAQLKNEFKAQVADKLTPDAADKLWDQILARLMPDLNQYADAVGDARLSDTEVLDKMHDVQGEMLDDLLKQLRDQGARQLADRYIARVKDEVAPKIAQYYKDQVDRKIGAGIRDAGTKIINDDATAVRAQRLSVSQALTRAETQARAAQTDLTQVKAHLDQASKAAAAATTPAQKAAAATSIKTDQAAVDRAVGELANAEKAMGDMKKGSDALPGNLKDAISNASIHPAATQASGQAEIASKAVKAAKLPEAATAASDAAEAAGQFVAAIHDARTVADKDTTQDPNATTEARVAVRQVRDANIKPALNKKFNDVVATTALPRLGQELTDAFKKTLDQAGMTDDAVVKDVQEKVSAALGEKVKEDVQAGETGTKPLTAAQKLDEVKDEGADDGPHAENGGKHEEGGHGAKARHHGPGQGGGAESADAAGTDAGGDAHQKAVAAKMQKAADDLTGKAMEGIAGDKTEDKAIAAMTNGNGKDNAGGADGMADLINRIGRLADNVKAGSAELDDGQGTEDGLDGGGGGKQIGTGPDLGSGASGRLSRLRSDILDRSLSARGGRLGNADFDPAQYARLRAAVSGRDANTAHGQAIELHGASGATMDIAALVAENKNTIVPAGLVVPAARAEMNGDLIGIAEHKEPYRPAFKNICFATIPYRSKPITLDGDLSEWTDVKALPMYAAGAGAKDHSVKSFPQEVKVQWDNTGFFICADVKKADNKIIKTTNGAFWEGDGMEIFVDTQNTKYKDRTAVSHQFWAWVDGAANTPLQVGGENVEYPNHDSYVPWGKDKIQVGAKQTESGWRMEIHIPKERFRKLDLKPGRILGMNFSICTGTNLYYYWAGTTEIATSQRPDTWGDAMLAGSDGRLECVDKLSSELKGNQASKNQRWAKIGQPLRIRVTDPDMNLDDANKEKLSVSVSSPHGTAHQVILEETGPSTGIFEGAIATAAEIGDPMPDAITLYDGENIDVTYIDQCRADGARDIKVKLSIPTASALTALAHP